MILLCSICQSEIPLAQPVDQNKRLATAVVTAAPCPNCNQVTEELRTALIESVKLQSHYAELLNQWDGGQRIIFTNAHEWLDRLRKLKARK